MEEISYPGKAPDVAKMLLDEVFSASGNAVPLLSLVKLLAPWLRWSIISWRDKALAPVMLDIAK